MQAIVAREKEKGKYHEHIKIQANSTGHCYESLFGRFLDGEVREISVEVGCLSYLTFHLLFWKDPYLRSHHQLINLLRLCELSVARCPALQEVRVLTSRDPHQAGEQEAKLTELQGSLAGRGVTLSWQFSPTLHDREVRLNTGWVVRLGRGLDIYKAPDGKMSLGCYDLNLRKCLDCTVDIYFKK